MNNNSSSNNNDIFIKKKRSFDKDLKNVVIIDKWEYERIVSSYEMLEKKIKRIDFVLGYLSFIKPAFIFFKSRYKWEKKFNELLQEKEDIADGLNKLHIELEELIEFKSEKRF